MPSADTKILIVDPDYLNSLASPVSQLFDFGMATPEFPLHTTAYFQGKMLQIDVDNTVLVKNLKETAAVVVYHSHDAKLALDFNRDCVSPSSKPSQFIFAVDNHEDAKKLQPVLNQGQHLHVNLNAQNLAIAAEIKASLEKYKQTGMKEGVAASVGAIVSGYTRPTRNEKRDALLQQCLQVENSSNWYSRLQAQLKSHPLAAVPTDGNQHEMKGTPAKSAFDNIVKLANIAGEYYTNKINFRLACQNLGVAIATAVNNRVFYSYADAEGSVFGGCRNYFHSFLSNIQKDLAGFITEQKLPLLYPARVL